MTVGGLAAMAKSFANLGVTGELLDEIDDQVLQEDLGVNSRLDRVKVCRAEGGGGRARQARARCRAQIVDSGKAHAGLLLQFAKLFGKLKKGAR